MKKYRDGGGGWIGQMIEGQAKGGGKRGQGRGRRGWQRGRGAVTMKQGLGVAAVEGNGGVASK